MAQIIKLDTYTAVVGLDDGTTTEVSKNEFDFELTENMEITAYKRQNGTYVFTKNSETKSSTSDAPYDYKYVKKIPYCLLFFFFGQIGIHEFYARNPKKGILWIVVTVIIRIINALLRGGFPLYLIYGVIVLILVIKTCFKKSNERGEILIKE